LKKILCVFIALFSLVSTLFSGCARTDLDIIVGVDLLKYNRHGTADFGFNLNLITPSSNTSIEFVAFHGENTHAVSTQFRDDTFDSLKSMKHNGYYIRLLGFVCHSNAEKVIIKKVTLRIDGEEKSFTFSTPIEHSLKQADSEPFVQFRSHTSLISTRSYETTRFFFEYHTETAVTITGFSFSDFLYVKEATVVVNGETRGQLADVLPLTVDAGSHIALQRCYLGFKDNGTSTSYDSVYCDAQLSYSVSGSTIVRSVTTGLVSQSVSNNDDARNVIDLMRNNSASKA